MAEDPAEFLQRDVDVIISDDNESIEFHQPNQISTDEIECTIEEHTKASNKAAERQKKAYELTREERDKDGA